MNTIRHILMIALAGAWLSNCLAAANEPVQIDEWTVPYHMDGSGNLYDSPPTTQQQETRPRDPQIDSRGRVWFVGQMGNYVAVLDPTTGNFKRYELEAGAPIR